LEMRWVEFERGPRRQDMMGWR